MDERDTFAKNRISEQNLKVIDKICLALEEIVLASYVFTKDLNHLYYASTMILKLNVVEQLKHTSIPIKSIFGYSESNNHWINLVLQLYEATIVRRLYFFPNWSMKYKVAMWMLITI